MSSEAQATSEIEDGMLDRDELRPFIRRQLGLATNNLRVRPAEQRISEVMSDLYRNSELPLDDATLFAWHRMVSSGRADLAAIGHYRTHPQPMRVRSVPVL